MSKLNEEIIECLQEARHEMGVPPGEQDVLKRSQLDNRIQLLLNYFEARRHIEECRRDEEVFDGNDY